MMKFSIGYQLPDEYDSIGEIVQDYREHISSVYFSAPGQASARFAIDHAQEAEMLEELAWIRAQGVGMTLLFNANCYGELAVSAEFRDQVVRTVENLEKAVGLTGVTTTSPFVAKTIKHTFPEISVCASVNMWIGTTQAMQYLGDDFDAFYLQREYNRDLRKVKQLSDWCKSHNKKLRMLANSGCLYTCPFHSFHDNLVAHEPQMQDHKNVMSDRPSPCWDYMYSLSHHQAAATFLQESWIRPEDIQKYDPYFDEIKLATRMHSNPRRVVAAYVNGRFHGNMFDLTEPSYSRRFAHHVLDAEKFPDDWFEHTTNCSKDCESCGYCMEIAKQMLVPKLKLEQMYLSPITD